MVVKIEKVLKEPVARPTSKPGEQKECCPLFSLAYHSKGSITWAMSLSKGGSGWKENYVFEVPAKGRGKARTNRRCFVIEHCPFCGAPPMAAEDVSAAEELVEKALKR